MTRNEAVQRMGQAQIELSAHSSNISALMVSYASASMLQDTKRMNDIRETLHNTMDLALDASGLVSHWTRELIKLNDY